MVIVNFGRYKTNKLLLFGLLIFFIILNNTAEARDYSVEKINANINVTADGIVHVNEIITYNFDGTYREVYRNIYPPIGGSIQNITGSCNDGKCKFEVRMIPGGYELVGVLPDPTPSEITFNTTYDYYGGLKVYNDVTELHYKILGDQWDKNVNDFTATVTLPAQQSDITYWLHPARYTTSSNLSDNKIHIFAESIPSNSWYEIRTIFPRLNTTNPKYVQIYNYDALAKIKDIEKDITNKQKIADIIFVIYILLGVLLILAPIYLYFKYGREPKISYNALYERELPDNSKPTIVNAILQLGTPSMDGFAATIMDLINRDYFTINDRNPDDIILKVVSDIDTTKLVDYEQDVYNLITKHMVDGQLHWKKFKSELKKGTSFYDFIQIWNSKVSKHIEIKKLFINEGVKKMTILALFFFIISFGGIFIIPAVLSPSEVINTEKLFFIQFIIAFLSVFIIVFSNIFKKVLGRSTPEGKLYETKWNNFKKYITDYSALKDHPPGSVKIWDHYMVYAMALGVAEEALKNMSLIVPEEIRTNSHFYNAPYFVSYRSDFNHAYSASSPSSSTGGSSGIGGAGGGFGGGGGGAR